MDHFDPHREDPAQGFMIAAWQPANRIELAKRWKIPRFSYTHLFGVLFLISLILWQWPALLGGYATDEVRAAQTSWVAISGGLTSIGVLFMLIGRWSTRRWRAVVDWRSDRVVVQRTAKRIEFPLSAIDGVELRGWWHEGRAGEKVHGGAREPDYFRFHVVLLLTDPDTGDRRAVTFLEPDRATETHHSVRHRAKRGAAFPELPEEASDDDLRDPVRKYLWDKDQDPRDTMVVVRQRERLDGFATKLAEVLDVPYVPLTEFQQHGVPRPE